MKPAAGLHELSNKTLEMRIQEYLDLLLQVMLEAQVRGLVVDRTVETDTGPRGLGIQQHLTMPTDQGIPEITIKLWERVNAPRTAEPEAK